VVQATSDDADGECAVFVTNRDHVAPDEITHVTSRYSRHWDIENQYKSVKAYLPKTSSTDYRVRLFNFTFATLLYNLLPANIDMFRQSWRGARNQIVASRDGQDVNDRDAI
jgi:hypothetical protein